MDEKVETNSTSTKGNETNVEVNVTVKNGAT